MTEQPNWTELRPVTRRRQWHPTPVPLPGKSHGRRSLVGRSPWGHEEWDMTEKLHFHFHALKKEMAAHSSVLAWRILGTAEPGGLPSMGLHRVRYDSSDLVAAAASAGLLPNTKDGNFLAIILGNPSSISRYLIPFCLSCLIWVLSWYTHIIAAHQSESFWKGFIGDWFVVVWFCLLQVENNFTLLWLNCIVTKFDVGILSLHIIPNFSLSNSFYVAYLILFLFPESL